MSASFRTLLVSLPLCFACSALALAQDGGAAEAPSDAGTAPAADGGGDAAPPANDPPPTLPEPEPQVPPPPPENAPAPPPPALPPPSAADAASEYGASAHAHRPGPGGYETYGTGSRFNVPLEEIPATVNVIDQQMLQEHGALSVDQALFLEPGVTPIWEYGGFLHLSMRGFQALTLYDGVRDSRALLADSAPQTGILDLDRLEVLRGPASVLYGYGSVGGVVNLIHKSPSRDPHYELELGMGLPNQHIVHGGAQGPLGDLFSYRVDVGQVVHTDFRGASTERNQATASLRFTPDRRDTFELRGSISRDHYNTDVGIPTVEDPDHPGRYIVPSNVSLSNRYNTANDHIDYQRIDLAASYRHDISDVTYLQARLNFVDDHYAYSAAESLDYVAPMDMTPAQVDRGYLSFARGWTPLTGQLELHSEAHTGPLLHKLAVGYELDSFRGATDNQIENGEMPNTVDYYHPVDLAPKISQSNSSINHYRHITNSFYGFDHIHILDNLIVTGGLRGDLVNSRVRKEYVDPELGTDIADPNTGAFRAPLRNHLASLTGQGGIVFTPWSPLTAYVSYASSFTPIFISPSDKEPTNYSP
ncbi:MAG TPA: TonB-dependent receptor, partial [Polyangiales bacterium]|nr:TonB-dependent receptor [Polyangiales bacterium]